ncbi:arginine deiminase [Ligilactobacillus salitolerans]|uniref:Arginine deiminase n=1 Tax=Ligilactobacillus salitolerans TaxID=1808352 RepID=A0A401IWG5_9LACO|nr:arginine deiminase [Ligilactobacillus salitolerans]
MILKRPGQELENLTPATMSRLLFDDIPYLPAAQEEHDYFAATLRENGTKVLYLDDLVVEALQQTPIKEKFAQQMLREAGIQEEKVLAVLTGYLINMETQEMVALLMKGIRKIEVAEHLGAQFQAEEIDHPFLMEPLPNLYFTRDPAAAIGSGVALNSMTFATRKRESLFMEYVLKYHPRFQAQGVSLWHQRERGERIEGGDQLVLNEHVMAIGISQRTAQETVEKLAQQLFAGSSYDTVIGVKIPHNHAMMHLDTVFTMINYDQFTVHPLILNDGQIDLWIMHPGPEGQVLSEHRTDLLQVLKEVLHQSELDLIPTGDGDPLVAAREQWNDGTNTLALAPGEVVTYDRNYVSNELLRKHGVKVHEIRSSELSRGRGGPRCMSMPIVREDS